MSNTPPTAESAAGRRGCLGCGNFAPPTGPQWCGGCDCPTCETPADLVSDLRALAEMWLADPDGLPRANGCARQLMSLLTTVTAPGGKS